MIIVIEKEKWLEIYSDNNKKIYEFLIDHYWNNSKSEPIAVDKTRYANGDYIESLIDCDPEEEINE